MNTSIGKLFIISAASGVGKTTLVRQLINKIDNIVLSVSHTTRSKRPNEQNGIDYFFINQEIFIKKKNNGEFLEHAEVFGNYYGTSKQFVINHINNGKDVILEIDYQGAKQIKNKLDCVGIYIFPPSLKILTNRLTSRKQDSVAVIQQRLDAARSDMRYYTNYDYIVINDNFDQAVQDLANIIYAQRLTIASQKIKYANLINSLL